MEDVLEVYTRPHDPARPLVCLDETSKQLVAETSNTATRSARSTGTVSTRFLLRSLRRLFSKANVFSRSSAQAELLTRCHSIVTL